MKFSVVIPTYNGGTLFRECVDALLSQTIKPEKVLVVDSSSPDDTVKFAKQAGFEVVVIPKQEFDHGGTRSKALEYITTPIVVYLTQDAILHNEKALENLVSCFFDQDVGAAYGRQLPHYDANMLAIHARNNSYKETSYIATINGSYPKGFRKAFISNSFAAYRVKILEEVGGFPSKLILGEDSYAAAKLLANGKKVAYCADAQARHSHNYTIAQEFKRYFDIGVFHETQKWMMELLGSVDGEGVKFALDQCRYVVAQGKPWLVPWSAAFSLAKYLGYRLGRHYRSLALTSCIKLSMHKGYWRSVENS